MENQFKKNLAIISYSWKDFMEYRGYMVFWIVLESLGFFLMYFLWMYIYQGNNLIAGYTLSSMITYYFIVYILKQYTVSYFDWNVVKKIRTGEFAQFLYRPLGAYQYYFFKNIGEKLIRIIASIPVLVVMFLLLRNYFIMPVHPFWFLIACSISFLLNNWLIMILSYIAFWTENGEMFIYFKDSLIYYLSGAMIPLILFGKEVAAFLRCLPFRYFVSFPVEIYLGKVSINEIYTGLAIAITWLMLFIFLEKWIYKKGVKKFSAVGN